MPPPAPTCSVKSVAVIGAGPAGALAALVLKRHGMDPVIYEKRRGSGISSSDHHDEDDHSDGLLPFWEVGGSIDLMSNGLRALDHLGLLPQVLDAAAGSCTQALFMLIDGSDRIAQNLVASSSSSAAADRPPVQILRSSFHRLLMDECERAGIPVHLGKRLVAVAQSNTSVVANFADGSAAEAAFLVAADGIHSAVRALVFPATAPPRRVATGFVGVFDLGASPAPGVVPLGFDHGQMGIYLDPVSGNGVYTVHCPRDDAGAWMLLQARLPGDGDDPDWMPVRDLPGESSRLGNIVDEWGAPKTVSDAVRYSKRITPIQMWDLPDLPSLYSGRVVFVGDSGHGTIPAQGQGLSQAIEDCDVLHELLNHFPNFSDAATQDYKAVFRLYDEVRLPRVHFVAARSRQVLGFMTAASPLLMRIGRLIFRTIVTVRNLLGLHDAIIAYDCDTAVAKAIEKFKSSLK
ncbi:hypothetical protein HK405_007057 [Cladochytrium tenue]|nr:hypothetical protein HK405_007057 [Cladochytrium tenue]